MVYQPKRSVKVSDIQLSHMVEKTRYKAHWVNDIPLRKQLEYDVATLNRYMSY